MKIRAQIALMGALISVALHLYLSQHYYLIKFGLGAGESVCNLNAKFNCDAVAASDFSSVFQMPIALWGAATNAILFLLILFSWLEWNDHPERLKRWTLALSGLSAAASIVMGTISLTQMQTYCIFCISLYVLSFIVFFAFKGFLREPFWPNIKDDLEHLWPENKGIVVGYAAIPVLAYLTHTAFMQDLGASQIQDAVREAVDEWITAPKQNFVAKPTLVAGPSPEAAAMVLAEFADFRCSHCRHAYPKVEDFIKSHPDVRLEFYSFPLDGACNDKIPNSTGMSCRLAASVYCAEKEHKGWELHHKLYDIQDDVNRLGTVSELDPLLAQTAAGLGLNWEQMQTCMNDPVTQDAIRAQAKQGALVNVQGTPTFFANGKLLNGGQSVPVLQAVHNVSLEDKKK